MVLLLPSLNSEGDGNIAQLVEHRTENPGVPGSNPGGTTKQIKKDLPLEGGFFYIIYPRQSRIIK